MTVCIAALSDNGRKVVTIADRMVVSGAMGQGFAVQREGKSRKIIECAHNAVFMQSGNVQSSEWINSRLKDWVGSREGVTVAKIYHQCKTLVLQLTAELRDQFVRAKFGDNITFSELSKTIATTQAAYCQNTWQDAMQINGGDLLIAGVDTTGGEASASIYYLPSVATTLITQNMEPFWAIGCGALHALELLEIYDYNATWSLSSSLYAAYCAKCAAELSPGVDKEIDIKVITEDGIQILSEKTLKTLQDTYEAEWSRRKDPDAYPLVAQAVREMGL